MDKNRENSIKQNGHTPTLEVDAVGKIDTWTNPKYQKWWNRPYSLFKKTSVFHGKSLLVVLSSILLITSVTGVAYLRFIKPDKNVEETAVGEFESGENSNEVDSSDVAEVETLADGTVVTTLSDGTVIITHPDGSETVTPPTTPANPISSDPNDTIITQGESIQNAVDLHPEGTTFTIKTGVHRLQEVTPKNGQIFQGETGSVMSGAKLLSSFKKEGNYWVASGQTQQQAPNGTCNQGYDACQYAEEVFIDGVIQQQVGTLSAISSGKWYFDYANDKIYLPSDPKNKTIETSVSAHAFSGSASNVVIRGIIIEKYATPAQKGAIEGRSSSGWLIDDVESRWNHGEGISLGNNMTVKNSFFHHNGRTGIGGGSVSGSIVDSNEISFNCVEEIGFQCMGWGGGGAKVHGAKNIVFKNNYVHDNYGPGLHVDGAGDGSVFDNNTIEDNAGGISVEISCNSVIKNNTIQDNNIVPGKGAGITVISSPNVEIHDNTIINNTNGIIGREDGRGLQIPGCEPADLTNLYVHNNYIKMSVGVTGVTQDVGSQAYFTSKNNRFQSNTYELVGGTNFYRWKDQKIDRFTWQSYGQDTLGVWK